MDSYLYVFEIDLIKVEEICNDKIFLKEVCDKNLLWFWIINYVYMNLKWNWYICMLFKKLMNIKKYEINVIK